MIWQNGYFKSKNKNTINTTQIYKETDEIFNIDYMNWSNDKFPDLLKACKENKIICDSNPYSFYPGLWKVSEYSDNKIILFYETIYDGGQIFSIMFTVTPTKMEETVLTQIKLTSTGDGTKYLSNNGTYKEISSSSGNYFVDPYTISYEDLISAIDSGKHLYLIIHNMDETIVGCTSWAKLSDKVILYHKGLWTDVAPTDSENWLVDGYTIITENGDVFPFKIQERGYLENVNHQYLIPDTYYSKIPINKNITFWLGKYSLTNESMSNGAIYEGDFIMNGDYTVDFIIKSDDWEAPTINIWWITFPSTLKNGSRYYFRITGDVGQCYEITQEKREIQYIS